MTHVRPNSELDLSQARRRIEHVVGVASFTVGILLTFGGLALAISWRIRFGGFVGLRLFYLYEGWAFGSLEILAGVAMLRRWPTRWILEMLPLIVPVIGYQYFILHFIYHRV